MWDLSGLCGHSIVYSLLEGLFSGMPEVLCETKHSLKVSLFSLCYLKEIVILKWDSFSGKCIELIFQAMSPRLVPQLF